ncbi:chorismate-binding protein [Flavimarina sp. Hel_I_48]|uniref:chorismate-binding protein n=1 Tax=Flavimarina sp. Hel_I_48 TaxID=1392488 RepID=UPI0004DEFA96|nr:chorismate-binding protein [Flavimarina sp. Hel_I_48]
MTATDVFHRLAAQYAMGLPFVAYKKPREKEVQVIFQNDTQVHEVQTFMESGFVFAPFNKEKSILIPGKPLKADFYFTEEKSDFELKLPISDEKRQKHIHLVEKAIGEIKRKNLIKVVLSRQQNISTEKDPLLLFKTLANVYPDAFTYIFYHPSIGVWLGATPETLLRVNGLRFQTMALAGTQVFEDSVDVQWGKKELEEQQLVTDEIVKSLKKFEVKNLNVKDRETVRAGNVLHLRSVITGVMHAKGQQLGRIISALHPTPAVCGLPREAARSFIAKEEGYDRAFYTGFLGELNLQEENSRASHRRNTENLAYKSIKKSTDLYVNLRCMQYDTKEVTLFMGGGVTRDSIPEREWEETVAKAQTMLRVL